MTSATEVSSPACWRWRLQGIVGLMLSWPHKEQEVRELMCVSLGLVSPLWFTRTGCKLCASNDELIQCSRCVSVMELLFSEELGLVLEVSELHVETVRQRYSDAGVQCHRVGKTCGFGPEAVVRHRPQHVPRVFSHHLWWTFSTCVAFCSGQRSCGWTGSAERVSGEPQGIMGGHQFPARTPPGQWSLC